jgi:sodium/potassium-transporting ATPase subunit beta
MHAKIIFRLLSEDASNFFFFISAYKTPGSVSGRGQNIYNCDYGQNPPPGQVCDVDIKMWAPCVQENNYNYHRSAPCIFLKLNKIFGWVPEYYNETTNLPEKMPEDLKNHIETIKNKEPHTVSEFSNFKICFRL